MLLLRKILLKVLLVARYQRFVQPYMYVPAIGHVGIGPPSLHNTGTGTYASAIDDTHIKVPNCQSLSSLKFRI